MKKKGELIPGLSSNLSATPSASRKQFKVEGLTEKQNAESLSRDLKTKPRWRVTRLKLSGGVSEGFVVFGDALVSFLKEGDAVAFSQPYSSIFQYGISEQADGVRDVFWVFQTPAKLLAKEESVRYVFTKISCEKCPEGVSFSDFWLEELDRAILESERRRSRLLKANPLGNSSKSIGLKLPSSKTLDVLAPTMMSSKITSMFALNLPNTTRLPPTVLLEDRFPCVWAEWKELISSLNLGLVNRDESVLVVLVPMQPGVFIMNPSTDGNADFLGEIIAIPWARIRSHGANPRTESINFKAKLPDSDQESVFVFKTPFYERIDALFTKFIYLRSDALFPTKWPPLRYDANNRPELTKSGLHVSPRKDGPPK